MKRIFELVRFNMALFFKSPRFVVPLLAEIIFLFVMYYGNNGKYDISAVLFITVFFSFCLMLWVGNIIISLKNERLEQILLLRTDKYALSISELLFVASHLKMIKRSIVIWISFLVTIVCYVIPMTVNYIGNGCLIKQHIQVYNVLCTLMIVWLGGIIGGVIGSLFHNNIVKDRKTVVLTTILIAILTLSREAIVAQVNWAKYMLFMLPPLDVVKECIEPLSGAVLFGRSCLLVLRMEVYIMLVCIIRHALLNRKLYG